MLCSYASTFKSVLATIILALGLNLWSQSPADWIGMADSILSERGELHFRIHTSDEGLIRELNTFISIDSRSEDGFEAYASALSFRRFLDHGIPFSIIDGRSLRKSAAASSDFPGDWDVYPTYTQYIDFMLQIAMEYPAICRLDTIGTSVQGRQLLYMKISDSPGEEEMEPAFLYTSSMHGDELTGYVLMLRLIAYLCDNYGSDQHVSDLVDNIEIWINPLSNPDGTYFGGGDSITEPKRFNANDIDLNRNFPGLHDGLIPGNQALQDENRAQIEFLKTINLVLAANIHGGEEVINYPFDTWEALHADDAWYRMVSREYVREAQQRSYPVLYMLGLDSGITNGWKWYEVEGGRMDWVNYFNHGREVTLEISGDKYPDPADLPFYWYYNYLSMLRFMEQSLFGIQGWVRDSRNGDPLRAEIRVNGHDSLESQVYSDSIAGYFARLIEPGTWDIGFSSPGYESYTDYGITSTAGERTWLDIELLPLEIGVQIPRGEADGLSFGPRGLHIHITHPGRQDLLIYSLSGKLLYSDRFQLPRKGEYDYPLDKLGHGLYIARLINSSGSYSLKFFRSQ